MIEDEIRVRLTQRLLAAQSRWGRWRLNAYVAWKGFVWRLVVNTTLWVKRALDIAASVVALVLFLPVGVLLAVLVKLDGGPVFSRETRVGWRGREFKMLKFRTTVVDAEGRLREMAAESGPGRGEPSRLREDPFVTGVGGFMRGCSVDELPQFLNVLRGEISLVGPRAPLPREVEHYSQADRRRLWVKPGMTCLWQAEGCGGGWRGMGNRGRMSFLQEVALDVRYIESQSVWLDLAILVKTAAAVLLGRGM
ncbi:MAG: sugar transferase [Verrucomicrobia bacterium]|nr:sugar transferase [Verrucomicrobiota bacterium]